jgi:hypothetical protein
LRRLRSGVEFTKAAGPRWKRNWFRRFFYAFVGTYVS